jgi:hypothetical protein
VVRARCRTGAGDLQTEDLSPPFPDGATGWHRVEVDIG